ncbi:MAG: PTS sugar transporter subunit IIA [Proteobacteria bacterium]|nr:PTS sugar transporter subunit IIA [Pseudomonadota bacterium]
MRIWKLIETKDIFLNMTIPDKDAIIRYIAETCKNHGIVADQELLYQGLQQREQTMSTGIGNGIAIPHTTNPEASQPTVIFIHLKKPVDFESIDNRPVDIIVAIVIPDEQINLHLQILARISRLCSKPDFLESIRCANSPESLHDIIREMEEKLVNY